MAVKTIDFGKAVGMSPAELANLEKQGYWITRDLYGMQVSGSNMADLNKKYQGYKDYQKANNLSDADLVKSIQDTDAAYSAAFDQHNETRTQNAADLKARKAADQAGDAQAKTDQAAQPAREADDRRKRTAAGGPGSTILTSPLGLPPEPQNVKRKTLLGM